MDDDCFNKIIEVLELIGQGFNKGISLIDSEYHIIWVNSLLEKKGFKISNVKGTFYQKTFDNKDSLDEKDPTIKAFKTGKVIDEIKEGADGKSYKVVSIPLKDGKNVEYVVEFTKSVEDYHDEELEKMRKFIVDRELKMVNLKNKIKELEKK